VPAGIIKITQQLAVTKEPW